jgi:predicted  nucleic acid-binding Zn-ribbon protein
MNADLESLVMLQAIDLELARLRAELAEAPARVAAAQTARAKAEVALTAAKNALAKEAVLRQSQETDVAGHRGKIARLTKQMETATSGAQITALEHEIAFAKQAIAKLEDEELASMERTEALDSESITAAGILTATTAHLERQRAQAAEVTARNTARVAEVESERGGLRGQLASTDDGERLLANYDRIARGKGTALAEAVDHKCSACQMMLRPQRWNDLTDRDPHSEHKDAVFTCETCGRMLFYDPRHDTPGVWGPGERLAAARKG